MEERERGKGGEREKEKIGCRGQAGWMQKVWVYVTMFLLVTLLLCMAATFHTPKMSESSHLHPTACRYHLKNCDTTL